MSLSKLAEACKVCPIADKCKRKRMEAVGCLCFPPAEALAGSGAASLADTIARGTANIDIQRKMQTAYREEIERQLQMAFAGIAVRGTNNAR